jgi:hypothetical protein
MNFDPDATIPQPEWLLRALADLDGSAFREVNRGIVRRAERLLRTIEDRSLPCPTVKEDDGDILIAFWMATDIERTLEFRIDRHHGFHVTRRVPNDRGDGLVSTRTRVCPLKWVAALDGHLSWLKPSGRHGPLPDDLLIACGYTLAEINAGAQS